MLSFSNIKDIKDSMLGPSSRFFALLVADLYLFADIVAVKVKQVSVVSPGFLDLSPGAILQLLMMALFGFLVCSIVVFPFARMAGCFVRIEVDSRLKALLERADESARRKFMWLNKMYVQSDTLLAHAIDNGNSVALQVHDRHQQGRELVRTTLTFHVAFCLLAAVNYWLAVDGQVTAVALFWSFLPNSIRALLGLVMVILLWGSFEPVESDDKYVYLPGSASVPTEAAKREASEKSLKDATKFRPVDL